MRLIFWGTPAFALPALRTVAEAGHEIAAVVTRPDRPAGRGRKTKPSPVRTLADERGYRVLAPERPGDPAFVDEARRLEAEVSVVAAYGLFLSDAVLEAPARGSLNVHPSLLPALRGAAPVNWAIARGFDTTGVTIMRMVRAMDAGPILAQATVPIGDSDTAALLSRRLSELGAGLLADTLARLEKGAVEEVGQDHEAATFAPKVDRAAAHIDWSRRACAVSCLIRAMDDVPGAWSVLNGAPLKLFAPEAASGDPAAAGAAPGQVLSADPSRGLVVATGDGALRIGEVQQPGRRRIAAEAWLCGRGARVGDVLS